MTETRESPSPRPMAAGHVIVVMIIALLGGGILNARALTDAAARQPFGWKRNAAVVAATPFRGLAGLLGLDSAHATLSEVAADVTQPGHSRGGLDGLDDVAVSEPPPTPSEDATARPSEVPTGPRVPTRREPLRVWVGGDSLTSEFGPALADRLARTRRSTAEVEFRFSTGLSRPDFFDWPARLREVIAEHDPEVFVVMFGANDGQNIAVDGTVLQFGSPQWKREYGRRVTAVMDLLTADGATLHWVAQPVMRSPDFDQKMKFVNAIYQAKARGREHVHFTDTRRLFSEDGAFAAYLDDADGQRVLMRQQDGVHLTRAGGEHLTDVVFARIDREFRVRGRD